MREAEKKRESVTAAEIEHTRELLSKTRVPSPRNPKPADTGQPTEYRCMRCGHHWSAAFQVEERTCPQCRSNSIRWL